MSGEINRRVTLTLTEVDGTSQTFDLPRLAASISLSEQAYRACAERNRVVTDPASTDEEVTAANAAESEALLALTREGVWCWGEVKSAIYPTERPLS